MSSVCCNKYISHAGYAADQYGFGNESHELWLPQSTAALQVLSAVIATQTSHQQEHGICAEHESQQQSANGRSVFWPAVLHPCRGENTCIGIIVESANLLCVAACGMHECSITKLSAIRMMLEAQPAFLCVALSRRCQSLTASLLSNDSNCIEFLFRGFG